MTVETYMAMLGGALVAAMIYGLYLAGVKAIKASKELVAGIQGIGKIVDGLKSLDDSSRMVATELQLLRSVVSATQQAEEVPYGGNQAQAEPLKTRRPFPKPNFDIYTQVPDAKEEDTDIVDTSDEKLAEYEKIEELRQQGIEADPAELEGE